MTGSAPDVWGEAVLLQNSLEWDVQGMQVVLCFGEYPSKNRKHRKSRRHFGEDCKPWRKRQQ